MQKLHDLVSHKIYWLLLASAGFSMLGVALFYQYVLGDEPCEVCVHVRIWVSGITLLSLLMLAIPLNKATTVVGNLITAGMATGLLERSIYLYRVENGDANSACSFYLNFPDWFALDKWLPAVFEVRNLCSFSPELIWGITMTHGLIFTGIALIICSLLAATLVVFWGRKST